MNTKIKEGKGRSFCAGYEMNKKEIHQISGALKKRQEAACQHAYAEKILLKTVSETI